MPKISIFRERGWSTRYKVELYVDGQRIGYISNVMTKEFEVPAGQHTLKAKARFVRSKDLNFTLFNKEKKSFVITTNKFLVRPLAILALLDIVIFGKNYQSEHKFISIFKTVSVLMTVLIAVYYRTIGRNNYLIIKEEGRV